jgi:aminoglycoside phosphotransferase (APT) family kinase protein
VDFTLPHLTRYLRHRLGEDTQVLSSERFSRGTSRQTWFVELRRPGAQAQETVVFRGDLSAGSIEPSSLAQEYFMYERLGHTNVPVARVLWWEDDPAWTDTPFYVREKIEGDWNIPNFLNQDPAYDELRIEVSREHMRKLALVHRLDWKALGFDRRLPAPRDEASCALAYVDNAMRQFNEVRGAAIPMMIEAEEWLRRNAPVAPCISLCKGTNGFGEEVWRGREIVAMSDWEEASIGDPAADLAFMQYLAPEIERDGRKLWGLEHALDYYRSVSGIAVSLASVRYYEVIRAVRLIIMAEKSAQAVKNSPELAEVRQAWTATEVGHVCRMGVLAAMGIAPAPSQRVLAEFHETIEAPL